MSFTAQNGRRFNYRSKVVADGCKKAKRKRGKRGKDAKPKGDRR